MTSTDMSSLHAAAVRNNAAWCVSVCRSHGSAGTFGERVWRSSLRTPPYYPDAITLRRDPAPDVFRPALLDDPTVRVLALHDGEDLRGGFVLNSGTGLVGLGNLFAAGGTDAAGVWSAAITAAADHFPGLPLVGYEHGDDLRLALASGFTPIGALRIWLGGS